MMLLSQETWVLAVREGWSHILIRVHLHLCQPAELANIIHRVRCAISECTFRQNYQLPLIHSCVLSMHMCASVPSWTSALTLNSLSWRLLLSSNLPLSFSDLSRDFVLFGPSWYTHPDSTQISVFTALESNTVCTYVLLCIPTHATATPPLAALLKLLLHF